MTSPSTDLNLSDRVALVTGGTRGIGLECARTLAKHGCSVVVTGQSDASAVEATLDRIANDFQANASYVQCDSRDSTAIANLYKDIRSEYGRLDILINNAGFMQGGLLGMVTDDAVRDALEVNVSGVIHHIQGAAKLMRKSGGSIVNMSSVLGIEGHPGQTVYAATKAAVIGATRSAAKELAPLGIRVNAIAPGFIDTDLTSSLSETERSKQIESIAMGRTGTPEDVAAVALFLSSELSTYVTGQVIRVDGGMII